MNSERSSRTSAPTSSYWTRNPLEDIRNTSKIGAVVVNGHLLDRTELDRLLTTAETTGRTLPPVAILSLVIKSRDSGNPFAGTWEADFPVPQQILAELNAAGNEVTGTIQTGGQTLEIIGGTVNGTEMRLRFGSPDKNRTIILTGHVNGDEIAFTRAVEVRAGGGPGGRGFFGAGGSAFFTARRTR
jgi:hypothetical protein